MLQAFVISVYCLGDADEFSYWLNEEKMSFAKLVHVRWIFLLIDKRIGIWCSASKSAWNWLNHDPTFWFDKDANMTRFSPQAASVTRIWRLVLFTFFMCFGFSDKEVPRECSWIWNAKFSNNILVDNQVKTQQSIL